MYINWKCYILWTCIEIKFHESAFNLNVYCKYVCILIIKDDWSCWIYLNLGFRSYGVISSSEQTLLKFEDGETQAGADTVFDDDEIAKIRREFDAAKQSFLKIPQALKEMPKMNPEGLSVHNSCFSVELNYSCQCCYWLMSCIQKLGIYVNKNLRLDSIQVYGFDYDYTLAHYSSNLQNLIYDLAKEHMVNEVSLDPFKQYW